MTQVRMTPGQEVIRWIEKKLFVPEGKLIGTPVRLMPWQKQVITDIYDNRKTRTRRALISVGRKNGKTGLAAMLMLTHLCGPRQRPNSQLYSTAQSREQAAIIYQLAAKIVRMSVDLSDAVQVRDGSKELLCHVNGARYRALSAEASTAFGLSPSFVVHDELGQVKGPRSALYEALETATGAQEFPLSVIISTQAATDADLLSVLIDDALAGHDPRTVASVFTAPMTDDPFIEATIRKANPAFGVFLNPHEVLAMADDARRMPAREPEFRNLILNQRVEANNPFVKPAIWKACAGTPAEIGGNEVYAGLDLSETTDLTAFVMIAKIDGIWQVHPTFWLPNHELAAKSEIDHVPYDTWRNQGYLQTTPGKSVDYEYVAAFMREMFDRYKIRKVAFDRWNFKHFKPWLLRVGFNEMQIEEKWVEFGQGVQSMSPALRDLESLLLEQQICHGDNPILNMCAANAVVEGKDKASRKLSKKNSTGRIDGLVALAMAVGVAPMGANVDLSAMIG